MKSDGKERRTFYPWFGVALMVALACMFDAFAFAWIAKTCSDPGMGLLLGAEAALGILFVMPLLIVVPAAAFIIGSLVPLVLPQILRTSLKVFVIIVLAISAAVAGITFNAHFAPCNRLGR